MENVRERHIAWSNSFSMKMKVIDDQHKGLVDFVNGLFDHSSGDAVAERAYFKEVIQQAIKYVKVHFATEEQYMMATKFSGYAEHKKIHDEFILTIVKTVKDYEAEKRMVLEKFAFFLRDWILSHIAIMDKQYSEYFWKIATRKPDGKLSITREDIE